MEGETKKFAVISEIFTHFTEKNRENLVRIAVNLLKVQKEDEEIIANVTPMLTEKK